jgi:hypothetical protein
MCELSRILARLAQAHRAEAYKANASSNRVVRLRGYGNAIVPQLAATFLRAFLEVIGRVPVPAWIPCPDCDDFFCTLHGSHVADCPCPDIDSWAQDGLDPYTVGGK